MCFDVSIPIRLICSTDGLLCLRSATTSSWHAGCRRGPSTPTIGGSVRDQPHLVGERITAAGAVGGELRLVQFDQVLGLGSGTGERLVKILCRSGLHAGDDEADVEALGGSLDPGTGTAIGVPGFRPVACLGEAAQAGLLVERAAGANVVGRRIHPWVQ